MKATFYKRGSKFNIEISGEKFENIFIQNPFYLQSPHICIGFHKSDFIMVIVARCNVVHRTLFYGVGGLGDLLGGGGAFGFKGFFFYLSFLLFKGFLKRGTKFMSVALNLYPFSDF